MNQGTVFRLYLDSTVIGLAADESAGPRHEMSVAFLAQVAAKRCTGYISDVVVQEVEAAPDWIQEKLERILLQYPLELLHEDQQSRQLAEKYVAEGVIPEAVRNDALHIAIAGVNNLDALVSYNFRHIVRTATMVNVNKINQAEGYGSLTICTPEEVLADEQLEN